MRRKYDLEQMLAEIRDDEDLDEKYERDLSQEKIHRMMIDGLRKRKAEKP